MAANSFATLTVPLSGAGAPTSMATFGPVKTFTVSGAFSAPVIIEATCDGVTFAPICKVNPPSGEPYFDGPTSLTVQVVCLEIRVSRLYGDSVAPTVTVSAQTYNDNAYAILTVPVGVGTGAASDTSTMGEIKTITVVGAPYSGEVIIEGSADAGVTYDPIAQFAALAEDGQHDVRTVKGVYNRLRVRRFGISGTAGLPVVAVGGASVYDTDSVYDPKEILFGAADGTIAQDNLFVWDETTDSLGVGTATPDALVDIDQGTITAQKNALQIRGTWNNNAVAFTGIFVDFTATNFTFPTYVFDYQVSAASVFKMFSSGAIAQVAGSGISPGYSMQHTWNAGGVPYIGHQISIVDTASAPESFPFTVRKATVPLLEVRKDGLTKIYPSSGGPKILLYGADATGPQSGIATPTAVAHDLQIYHGSSGGPVQRIALGGKYDSTFRSVMEIGNIASGIGVAYLKNCEVVPSGLPQNGGCFYATGGSLYWLGASGTVTHLAIP